MYANAFITNGFFNKLLLHVSAILAIFRNTIPILKEGPEDFYSLLITVKK